LTVCLPWLKRRGRRRKKDELEGQELEELEEEGRRMNE